MKVIVEAYCPTSDTYRCTTGKGRTVHVSLANMFEDTLAHLGGYYKVRNDSKGIGGVFCPRTDYQWYPLDPLTGKKLKTIAVEEL